jgi:hypothetical protein
MSASYFLSQHVHVCVAGRQVVLLDLERDKYLALAQEHPMGRWVRGWPLPPLANGAPHSMAADPAVSNPGPDNALLARMISQGLLVTDPAIGKEAAPVVADEPTVAVVEYDLKVQPRTTVGHLWRLFTAFAAAQWSLKHRPIKEVVRAVGQRRRRAGSTAVDIDEVRPLVAAFVHLRPLFYTAREACLLDSLTLINFLAGYGVFPQWIFGVKTDPFYAHCWVQQSDFAFNDTPDHLKSYSPILVV